MSRELEAMRKKSLATLEKAKSEVATREIIDDHLCQVQNEYNRAAELSKNAPAVIEDIDRQFKEKTKLENSDVIFLFLCTGLQCLRQYLMPLIFRNEKRLSAIQGDKLMENTAGSVIPKSQKDVKDILFQSVPYDALQIADGANLDTGLAGATHRYRTLRLAGATHRYRTLGHDPVLGWFFGTCNILTDSLTKSDIITTYSVQNMQLAGAYPLGTYGMIIDSFELIKETPVLLPTALARQAIHFGSDYFTKQGLPIPFLGTVAPKTAHRFMNTSFKDPAHLDLLNVSMSFAIAAVINQIIYYVHKMLYDEARDGPADLYEVRTRKILSYSNAMATGSNIIVVGLTRKVSLLDAGGIVETIHRLISDQAYINRVKRDFLKNELYKRVVGDQYDFMGVK